MVMQSHRSPALSLSCMHIVPLLCHRHACSSSSCCYRRRLPACHSRAWSSFTCSVIVNTAVCYRHACSLTPVLPSSPLLFQRHTCPSSTCSVIVIIALSPSPLLTVSLSGHRHHCSVSFTLRIVTLSCRRHRCSVSFTPAHRHPVMSSSPLLC